MNNAFPDLAQQDFTKSDIAAMLGATDQNVVEGVRFAAEKTLLDNCGNKVFFRGLIEFSNFCKRDCYYCGIRKSNKNTKRYEAGIKDVLDVADWCVRQGYGSMVIQAGERQNKRFVDRIEEAVKQVKEKTRSDKLPQGLGVTLSVGEQTPEVYQRFFDAGAHRYLLRIETTNPKLFANIHPSDQTLEKRISCLRSLREVGYQVGTGVMIGLPGQTVDDLADDILFFKQEDIDMIGMGPFIPNSETPLGDDLCDDDATRVRYSLLMIAVIRLVLKDVNIASTTALQALDPSGREKGLRFGANVMMPLMTPQNVRENYLLYPGKPGLQDDSLACHNNLVERIKSIGREVAIDEWGDSLHFRKKQKRL